VKNNEIFYIPTFEVFNHDWEILQKFLERRGNPLYSIGGTLYLYLSGINFESLGNLTSVGGTLYLSKTKIKSLGNLVSVGGSLYLRNENIESLGNLTSVGGNLNLEKTPISKKCSEEEIRQMVDVKGYIYL
jgi:hypothetical protein